ncbi:hypothetical protein Tco_0554560 [Tanacetum coccineum]
MSRLICFGSLADSLLMMQSQWSHTTLEWSRFVTIVKQTHDLDIVSYDKLFDILKQCQKEVNEILAERIAKNANPLAFVAAAQQYLDSYCQAPKSHKSYAPSSKQSSFTRYHVPTRHKGKAIANHSHLYLSQLLKKTMIWNKLREIRICRKNLAFIAKYKNDNQTSQFRNQRTVTVVGARETVGSQECRKPKRVKDYTYHREKMLLCKQAEKGVPLQVEQADWLEDTDEEIDEQELEAHYSYMEKIQEVPTADSGTNTEPLEKVQYDTEYNVFANERQHFKQPESINNTCVVEKVDSNVILDSPDMCNNDNQAGQNAKACDDERVALANLITNLKLNIDENKKIQNQLKKANASLIQELKECKTTLKETNRTLGESNSTRDSCLISLPNKQIELEMYKTLNDRTIDYDKLERKLNETLGLLAQK